MYLAENRRVDILQYSSTRHSPPRPRRLFVYGGSTVCVGTVFPAMLSICSLYLRPCILNLLAYYSIYPATPLVSTILLRTVPLLRVVLSLLSSVVTQLSLNSKYSIRTCPFIFHFYFYIRGYDAFFVDRSNNTTTT